MENASKALIIAGAILITLIIIGLGVAILGSTEGATDTSTFDAMQVSTFNGKFTPYEGTIQGTKLDALLDVLLANARSNGDTSERPNIVLSGWTITITAATGITNNSTTDEAASADYISFIKALKDEIQSSHRYTVTVDEDDNTDLVHTITIAE